MAKKKHPPDVPPDDSGPDDMALWNDVAKTIEPLNDRNQQRGPLAPNVAPDVAPDAAAAVKKGKTGKKGPRQTTPSLPSTPAEKLPNKAPETLTYDHQPGLDKAVTRRLKRGQAKIEGRLDLHGMTQDEARPALEAFIERAARAGKREVLVITGKGSQKGGREGGSSTQTGVLRHRVPDWLNKHPTRSRITGYMAAAQKDGGAGALYVRLKRKKEPGAP